MNWLTTLTIDDAKTLLAGASVIGIPFLVTWLKAVTWPDWLKFAIAAIASLVVGFLTAYSNSQLLLEGTLIQNGAVIFMATQIVYYGAFRGLGLEKVLFPKSALAHHAEDQATAQVANISKETAAAILDPNATPALDVQTTIVGK